MRGLSQSFIDDLNTGILTVLRDRVLADRSICLEIREDYVNIYYCGGNLLELKKNASGYTASFNTRYAKGGAAALSQSLPSAKIQTDADMAAWIAVMPALKLAMDIHQGQHPKEEREAQQLILRDNNFGGVSRATDYYICDIEYANPQGRFDLVAVHWPSSGAARKRQEGRRLVLVEAKYGDGAIADPAGIHSHVRDINAFLGDATNLQNLKDEMVGLFNQKRALGLLNCGKDLLAFSDEPPMLLLLLANHDPDSTKLRTSLTSLPPSPHADLHLATGCFMGYGLFDQAIVPLQEAITRFNTCI